VLTIESTQATGTIVTAWVKGGKLGRTYDLTNHIVTSDDREYDSVITLVVSDDARAGLLGACEWPVDYSACGASSIPASGIAKYEDMAVEFLWRWTDQQFGVCEDTIRPCRQDCFAGVSTYGPPPHGGAPFQPVLLRGSWFNVGCGGGCGDRCGCSSSRALRFETPITDVVEVQMGGEVLSPDAYRVDDHRFLIRQDGGEWPYCQNMNRPLGDDDTWAVTVRVGAEVPIGGQVAAGKLALELYKAACGAAGCELPKRVQSISRQGVTVSMMLDQFEDLDQGKTGVWIIDSWVASVTKPKGGFSIVTPDYRPTGSRTTWM
jgi:hypothetical protein